jgi:2-aminoadipate transaminase
MPDEIETLLRQAAGDCHVIAMGGGLPSPRQFPRRRLVEALADVVLQPAPAALQYAWPEGEEGLRRRIADHLGSRGAVVEPDRILVTSGAQQALMISTRLLCVEGAPIYTDPETYPGALELFRSRGLTPIPLNPADGAPKAEEACALYLMPAVSNPRGETMSAEARRELLASGLPILEDDAYGDLLFAGPGPRPLLAEAPDRVFYIGTFSKTLAPGLRVGWLVAPERLHEDALKAKRDADLQSNGLGQAIVERYLREDGYEDRLKRLRTFYRRRARRLADAVRRELPGWRFAFPAGGFALWLEPDEPDCPGGELGLLRAAIEEGVSFDPGSGFRPDRAAQPLALRLCFSALDPEELAQGARRLARAWRRVVPSLIEQNP